MVPTSKAIPAMWIDSTIGKIQELATILCLFVAVPLLPEERPVIAIVLADELVDSPQIRTK